MVKIKLYKQKLAIHAKVSSILLDELLLSIGQEEMDIVNDLLTAKLDGYILSTLEEEKEITRHTKPQGFWDWVLRRSQTHIFTISCKDALLNPPKPINGMARMYFIK